MNIYEKLSQVQKSLKAPKNQVNKFGNYNYRSAEDILTALKPQLEKVGAIGVISDEVVEVGGRIYVKATAEIRDIESQDSVKATAYAREEETQKGMTAPQITGSASSYARKYALNGLYGIDDNKDDDTGVHVEMATKEQVAQLNDLYRETKLKVLDYYKIKDFNELSMDIASELIARKEGK